MNCVRAHFYAVDILRLRNVNFSVINTQSLAHIMSTVRMLKTPLKCRPTECQPSSVMVQRNAVCAVESPNSSLRFFLLRFASKNVIICWIKRKWTVCYGHRWWCVTQNSAFRRLRSINTLDYAAFHELLHIQVAFARFLSIIPFRYRRSVHLNACICDGDKQLHFVTFIALSYALSIVSIFFLFRRR